VLDRKLRAFFDGQADRIAGAIAKAGGNFDGKSLTDIDWAEEEDLLAAIMRQFYQASGEAAAASASSLLSVDIVWDLANPYVNQVAALLGGRIRGIARTTQEDVARIVSDGMTEGVGLPEIADRVRATIGGDAYKGRAMTISRTESMYAYGHASAASYAASGIVSEVELLDNSEHTESYGASDGLSCAERNGLVVPLADAGRHLDAEHPNGSLAIAPVVTLGEV
jgi:hypothetical protein